MGVTGARTIGPESIALLASPAIPIALGLAGGYAAVCLIKDRGINRAYAYEKPVPMSSQDLASVCEGFFWRHGLQGTPIFFGERDMVINLLKERESLVQDLSNATRRVQRREKTSWIGGCVRVVVDTISSGGKDRGTVSCAKKMEEECRERQDGVERSLSLFAEKIKSRLRSSGNIL